jgi:hypothetical protein
MFSGGERTMLKHYLEELTALEFSERDAGIQKAVTREKGAMNARGILHSSMTLQALAEFFGAEFSLRCDFLKEFVVTHSALCKEEDAVTTAKTLFQTKSFEQRDRLKAAYEAATKPIVASLSSDFPKQIEEGLLATFETRIKKNNMYVEIAYQAMEAAKREKTPMFALKPNFHGIGIDVEEVWRRYVKHN